MIPGSQLDPAKPLGAQSLVQHSAAQPSQTLLAWPAALLFHPALQLLRPQACIPKQQSMLVTPVAFITCHAQAGSNVCGNGYVNCHS